MTVRETLDFSGRCLGVGTRYELLAELSRREKEAGIKPDPEIDAFMKATAMSGQEHSLVTDYTLKVWLLSAFKVGPLLSCSYLYFATLLNNSSCKIDSLRIFNCRYSDWIFVLIFWLGMT